MSSYLDVLVVLAVETNYVCLRMLLRFKPYG